MNIFDRVDPTRLDRRDTQLWMMAIAMIMIFSVGIALLLYPAAFSVPVVVSGPFMRRAFFSFCALSLLIVGYLMERRIVVHQLRRRLTEEQDRARQLLNQASAELLDTLPGFEHFRDRLAMEFRRAERAQLPLSLLLANLKPSSQIDRTGDVDAAFGDAAKAIVRKLRGEDSIYMFRPGVFCVVLPGVSAANGRRVSDRLAEGLSDASGASVRFSFLLRIINFPEHASTAREMERAAVAPIEVRGELAAA
jgi:GGDEF domain-containing protein